MNLTLNLSFILINQLSINNHIPSIPVWKIAGIVTFVLTIIVALIIKGLLVDPQYKEKQITSKGIKSYEEKKYDIAINFFDESIKLNKYYADAYFNKARALIKINEHSKAIKTLKKFIEIAENPVDTDVAIELIKNISSNETLMSEYKRPYRINFKTVLLLLILFLTIFLISLLIINHIIVH